MGSASSRAIQPVYERISIRTTQSRKLHDLLRLLINRVRVMNYSLKPLALAGAVVTLLGAATWPTSRQPRSSSDPSCRSTDGGADGFRLYITAIDTGTTSDAASRRGFWHIPSVVAADIYFVTDSATCARAAHVH